MEPPLKLRVKRLGKWWWVIDLSGELIGPYPSKKEAASVRAGLIRSNDNVDTPRYWTTARRKK